jgi:hypothetical protein
VDAVDLAGELFRAGTGQNPPALYSEDWPEHKRYKFAIGEQGEDTPFYEVDGKTIHLNLHEGQSLTWESLRRFVFMIAGKQSGKTIFGPVWLLRQIQKLGVGDYLAVSASYELFNLKMLPELKKLFVSTLGIGKYWAGNRIIEIKNPLTGEFGATYGHEHEKMWARIILRTAASEEGLQSATAKAAWLDEPGLYAPSVWKDIRGRLSLHSGPALGTTTPYDLGWLKQLIFDKWEAGDKEIDVISFASILNKRFSQEEFESLRNSMQDHQFELDYMGKFGRPAAAIFKAFIDKLRNEGGHKVKSFPIPSHWPRRQAVDPGIINTSKLWAAHDPVEDVHYIYRSTMNERKPATEHAKDDLLLEKQNNERVVLRAIGAVSEKYWRDDYKAAGANGVVAPDTNDVEEGIDRIVTLLKTHRIYFFADDDGVIELIKEILEYARELDDMGIATDKIKDKSKFHRVDTLRYLAIQLVSKPKSFTATTKGDRYA